MGEIEMAETMIWSGAAFDDGRQLGFIEGVLMMGSREIASSCPASIQEEVKAAYDERGLVADFDDNSVHIHEPPQPPTLKLVR
jgi:hypothetical protein